MTASAAAIAPIVSAVTATRPPPGETGPEAIMALILSMGGASPMQVMFAGQLVAMHATFADASRDLLAGMVDTRKQKGQTTLVSLARAIQGHADRLDRMREKAEAASKDTRTRPPPSPDVRPPAAPIGGTGTPWNISPRMALEIMTAMAAGTAEGLAPDEPAEPPSAIPAAAMPQWAVPEWAVPQRAVPQRAVPEWAVPPSAAAEPAPPAPPETAPPPPAPEASAPEPFGREPSAQKPSTPGAEPVGYRRPEPPDSWLDEPVVHWLVETPADEAHRLGRPSPPAEAEPDTAPTQEPPTPENMAPDQTAPAHTPTEHTAHEPAAGAGSPAAQGEGFAARASGYRPTVCAEMSPDRPPVLAPLG